MITRFACLTALCLGLVLTSASQASSQEIIDELSDAHLTGILQDLGYENVEVLDKNEDSTRFRFEADGRIVLLQNYRKLKDIRIYIIFINEAGENRSTLTLANDWNRDMRWAKAYLNGDGDWILEADFDVQPGVTEDAIYAFIQLWMNTVDEFVEHIDS